MQRKCCKCKEELFPNENCFRKTKTLEIVCGSCFEDNIKEFKDKVFPATSMINDSWKSFVEKHGMKV